MLQPLLGRLTLLEAKEIEDIVHEHGAATHLRYGQTALARECLRLVRGSSAVEQAAATSAVVFSKQSVHELGAETLRLASADAAGGVQSFTMDHAAVAADTVDKIAAAAGLCQSVSEARRQIKAGGLYVNGKRVTSSASRLHKDELVDGCAFVLRSGKKKHVVVFVD